VRVSKMVTRGTIIVQGTAFFLVWIVRNAVRRMIIATIFYSFTGGGLSNRDLL
jgi:uncharacterized membrane protein